MSAPSTLTILGCGTMGKAILDGILMTLKQAASSTVGPEPIQRNDMSLSRFILCVSRPESVAALEDRYRSYLDQNSARTSSFADGRLRLPTVSISRNDNVKAVASADVVLLACKPHKAAFILGDPSIRQHLHGKLLISICVGLSAARIQSFLSTTDAADHNDVDNIVGASKEPGKHDCYIVHAMPNTAAALGQSATVLSTGSLRQGVPLTSPLPPDLEALVTRIFCCIGTTTFVPAELMNAASVVGASTPAFFATILDGMVKGGVQAGLSESESLRLAAQAMKGTAEMVLRGTKADDLATSTLAQIKKSVMTPNGCTERGVKVMTACRVEEAMTEATSQAVDRVFELEQETGV